MAKRATAVEPLFTLGAGALPLDFTNTVSDRCCDSETDRLRDYADLVAWARQAELIDRSAAAALLRGAGSHPHKAARILGRAIELRETIFRLFAAVAGGHELEARDLEALNLFLNEAVEHLRLSKTPDGPRWTWQTNDDALDRLIWPVAWSAAELLTSCHLERVTECNASDCRWLFLDRSRNRSRRWCDMKTCGNRTKARRYYLKKRST